GGAETVLAGRLGTVGWGATATIAALFADRLGPIINAFNMINSFLGGPILGIFLLGMLTRRTRGNSAIGGAAVGAACVSLLAWKTHVAFFYYAIVGTMATFVFGWLFGHVPPTRDEAELRGLVRGLDAPVSQPPAETASARS